MTWEPGTPLYDRPSPPLYAAFGFEGTTGHVRQMAELIPTSHSDDCALCDGSGTTVDAWVMKYREES